MKGYGLSVSGAEQTIEVLTDNETTPCETIRMLNEIIRSISKENEEQCMECDIPECDPDCCRPQ